MMIARSRIIASARLAPIAIGALVACRSETTTPRSRADSTVRTSAAPAIAPPSRPYLAQPVTNGGTVVGVVRLVGTPPSDSIVPVTTDAAVCGTRIVAGSVEHTGDHIVNAVVWLDDVRAGKPLPLEKRYTIVHAGCAIDPPITVGVVGGTLNVNSDDPVAHATRFREAGTHRDVALVRETDGGQVVPNSAVLAAPARLEITCDLHPGTHGWLQVFDQPYFALTDKAGAFTLDSVPPGTHHLKVWQPMLGTRDTSIIVRPGARDSIAVTMLNNEK